MKSTRYELTPDDPIFHGGVQVFKPVSRPSTKDSAPSTKNAEESTTPENNEEED